MARFGAFTLEVGSRPGRQRSLSAELRVERVILHRAGMFSPPFPATPRHHDLVDKQSDLCPWCFPCDRSSFIAHSSRTLARTRASQPWLSLPSPSALTQQDRSLGSRSPSHIEDSRSSITLCSHCSLLQLCSWSEYGEAINWALAFNSAQIRSRTCVVV